MTFLTSRLHRILCLATATSAWFISCEKVAQLSDSARVEEISILTADPDRVIFDQPVIKGEVIELPLVYGKYLFPITVSLNVKTESGCKQILGFDEDTQFTFDNQNHIRELYTVSASGATTRWKLQIIDAQSNEAAEIVRVGVTAGGGSETLVAPLARIDKINSEIVFQALGTAAYPLTFTPEFTLSDGADWADETEAPQKTLTFDKAESTLKYTIEAASGLTKTWTFRSEIIKQTDNTSTSTLTEDQVERLTPVASAISFRSETAQLAGATTEFNVSKVGGRINLMISPVARALEFPVKAVVELPIHANSMLTGAAEGNSYTFESYTDTKQVWIVDKISGLAKSWTLALAPKLNTDILGLTISTYSSIPGNDVITVDTDQVEIDHENSRITVPVGRVDGAAIDPKEKITLKLNFTLELPEGATSTSKSSSHTYVTNTASISVKTSNSQQSRTWTLYLRDKNAAASPDTSISNFSFAYTSKDNRMKLYSTSIVADNTNHRITLKITGGPKAFPLTLTNKVLKLGSSAATVVEQEIAAYDTPLTFESLASTKTFTVRAEDGTEQQWTIDLESQATGHTAEVTSFLVNKITGGTLSAVKLEPATNRIRMEIEGVPPFYATVAIETSDNASVTGLENGILALNSYNHEIPLTVTSQDEEVTKTWTVYVDKPVEVQIANSDFELWGKFKNINGGTYTIDPTPGAGYGWGTANLEIFGIGVLGTMPVDRADGTKGVEMTTSNQNTILYGYVVASGTLYTGLFNLNLNYITQPRKMTKFGIPYTARPTSFSMEVKYAPGPQMKEATADDKGKYSIHDIAGVDKAHIWMELLRWEGDGAIDYDGNPETAKDITVLGRAELVIDGANNPYKEWSKVTIPMVYNDQYADIKPTHIAVVMSSSKDGDKFIGAFDSKLSVDHFMINY